MIGEQTTSGNLFRRYVPGPGVDEVAVWQSATPAFYWPVTDERGSVIANTTATGSILTAALTYDEYGVPGAANSQRFQYTGQMRLGGTGLYYYKARVYQPTLGRFLQTDPVGYEAGLNLYAYVGGDPVNKTDPTGMVQQMMQNQEGRQRRRENSDREPSLFELVRDAIVDTADDVTGAINDFTGNYDDMREANTIGADKYFHCLANCEAASRGPAGEAVATVISEGREATDAVKYVIRGEQADSSDDQAANRQGRDGAQRDQPQQCRIDTCADRRPRGLPDEY